MARVLIVDDSISTRTKLKSTLTMLGHVVVGEAANGLQAYREYEKHKPDLVTMDITMPIMDGILSVKRIIEVFPDASIIMVSSLAQKHMILSALENGAKHYIIKPIDPDNLAKVINKVLEERNTERSSIIGEGQKPEAASARKSSPPDIRLPSAPFTIENRNGVFVVNISPKISADNLVFLNSAVQGLLFVKPLSVVVNFGGVEILENELLESLSLIMEYIIKSGGTLSIVSDSKSIVEFVKKKNLGRWNNIFSALSELSL